MRNRLVRGTLVALVFCGLASAAPAHPRRVYVQVGPPPIVVEERIATPGPNYVWIGGYHRFDGHVYVWVPGHWEPRPRVHAHWRGGHWLHARRGWYWQQGRWR